MNDQPNIWARVRYLELFEQLGDCFRHEHGWRKWACSILGVSPEHVFRIRQGTKIIGWDLLGRLSMSTGLPVTRLCSPAPLPPIHAERLHRQFLRGMV